jgi:SAM-dependent methyltransferase
MSYYSRGIRDKIDTRINAADEYATRVASKNRVLDIGGQNKFSGSGRKIRLFCKNPKSKLISTDISPVFQPDIVDDICNTSIGHSSFEGIFCEAVLEHVTEYWKAIDNIYSILVKGGEAFISVPFFQPFHGKTDYHRFTFTEVERMLNKFSEVKVFTRGPKLSGYGYVFWLVLTFGQFGRFIKRFPRLGKLFIITVNSLLKMGLYIVYKYKRKENQVSFEEYSFFFIYLRYTPSVYAWAKK